MSPPTATQVDAAAEICVWYFATHRGHGQEPGMPSMYGDPGQVGHFAVDLDALRQGEPSALFTALVTTVMFQRLRDVLVKKILLGISRELAAELTDEHALRARVGGVPCGLDASVESLRLRCGLAKHPGTKLGGCSEVPPGACHLHQHTEVLKRYGHFGKVPTSIALAVQEAGADDIGHLHRLAVSGRSPSEAAEWLLAALTRAWRVSDKIAAMFLSLVCNPDVLLGAPWAGGVDWTRFVVVDSNVDLFLESVGYVGRRTYAARAQFVRDLAQQIDLSLLDPSVETYNPRLVQQALYLFMSRSNRLDLDVDCTHSALRCIDCPAGLRARCPVAR